MTSLHSQDKNQEFIVCGTFEGNMLLVKVSDNAETMK